jgi:hypothetical protein
MNNSHYKKWQQHYYYLNARPMAYLDIAPEAYIVVITSQHALHTPDTGALKMA